MEIEQQIIGFTESGEVIIRYTLTNSNGLSVSLLNCGAAVESIIAPNGRELTITYPNPNDYSSDNLMMGKCVGRYAGRIAKGRIVIDDKSYKLTSNEGTTHLNGGIHSLASKLWQARSEEQMVVFSYISPASEEGYPAEFGVEVGYTLTDNNELSVIVMGESDGATIVNIAPHIYFTFGDEAEIEINSSNYLSLDRKLIPTGEIESVEGSDYDYRSFRTIDGELNDYLLIDGHKTNVLTSHATLKTREGDIEMNIRSTQPMLYINSCDEIEGCGFNHKSEELSAREALLLSPQRVAIKSFDEVTIQAEESYHQQTVYAFTFNKK